MDTKVVYIYNEIMLGYNKQTGWVKSFEKPARGSGKFNIVRVTTEPSDIAKCHIINKRIGQAYSKQDAELIVVALNNLEVKK